MMIQTTRSFMDVHGAMVTADTILPGRWQPQRVTIRDICEEVCARTGLTLPEIRGLSRVARVVQPRQEVMWLAAKAGKSTPEIGRFFSRDHTTVIHGIRAHQRRIGAAA